MAEDPRATLAELSRQIEEHFGERLLGLYLSGSLTTGDFVPGRSDLDLIAVVDAPIVEGRDLDALRTLHERFETEQPEWAGRIEALYVSREVLATFAVSPTGSVARVSPGEPLHLRDLEGNVGWRLDWYGVIAGGETVFGAPPLEVGPQVTADQFREAIVGHLGDLRDEVRDPTVAWVPARQGYLVATAARGLYALETGRQISKIQAIRWAAERYPESADLLWSAYNAYRADVHARHAQVIDLVDLLSRQ